MLTLPGKFLLFLIWLLALTACTTPPSPLNTPQPSATAGTQETERAAIIRMEQEVRTLAKIDGCADSRQCSAIPVGVKACGGPRFWLAYCPLTTDVAALTRRVEELRVLEDTFNRTYHIVSDCSLVGHTALVSVGGTCQFAQ